MPFQFTELPTELRLMVYSHLISKTPVTQDNNSPMRKHVDTAILQASSGISDEAAPILYTQPITLYVAPFSPDPTLGWLTNEFKIPCRSKFSNIEIEIDMKSPLNDFRAGRRYPGGPHWNVMKNLIRNMNSLRHLCNLKIRLHLGTWDTLRAAFGPQNNFKHEAMGAMMGDLNKNIENLTLEMNLGEKDVKEILKRYNIPGRQILLNHCKANQTITFQAAIIKNTYKVGDEDWTVIERKTMILGMQIAPAVPSLGLRVREVLNAESAAMVKECAEGQFYEACLPLETLSTD